MKFTPRSSFLRVPLWLLGAAAMFIAVFYLFALLVRPSLPDEAIAYEEDFLQEVDDLRQTSFDPEDLPVVNLEVDYDLGPEAPWWPKGESPVLRELVEQGELPPVEERVGRHPVVMRGVEGLGEYGGVWYRLANSIGDVGSIGWRLSGATLVRWSTMGYPIVPHVARDFEVLNDGREYIIHLREGMRWSDGAPFTADDILFWWEEDVLWQDSSPQWMMIRGELGDIEKIDDYTVRFVFPHPHGQFLERLAITHTFAIPRHYLEPFHPELGDEEKIERARRAMGLSNPDQVFRRLQNHMNPEHPRLWPWVIRQHQSAQPFTFVRNPYYFAVDEEGNQLPYLDRMVFDIRSPDMLAVTAAAGEVSMQARHIQNRDYTLFMNESVRNNFDVYHWFQGTRSVYTLFPNTNRAVVEDRPYTKWKHEFLNKREFRQALSLAIDRESIIRAEYNQQGTPAQIDPGPESPFHYPDLFHSYTDFDQERANELLDSIGLDQRDRSGYRTFPDGTRMTFFINVTDFTGSGPAQFIIDDWAEVGVRAILRERARSLFFREQAVLEHDFTVWTGESEFYPLAEPRNFVPTYGESFFAPAYGQWFRQGGLYGDAEEDIGQIRVPPEDHPHRRNMKILDEAWTEIDQERQIELFHQIAAVNAEEVWNISIATPPPQLVIVEHGFRNVPTNAMSGALYSTPANTGIETYFYEDPEDSEAGIARTRDAMINIIPDPTMAGEIVPEASENDRSGPNFGISVSRIVMILIWGSVIIFLALMAMKHPFVANRLIVLVPTLFVISVINFAIIQAPPGDYITFRITELELEGDDGAIRQMEDLKETFHYDAGSVEKYLRWTGIWWFGTFDSSDKGLLQGHLGRTMEDGRSVNDVVGDRILLTFLISLFTILFTYLVALPIGIYSAVRQYSFGDYVFTFFGFIGMCVPNFLLALLAMYFADHWLGIQVTGLFSREYAVQPEWSLGKVMDLMQRIWVPVLVVGLAGTAWMVRVMRGNLLDELEKPYVQTARAKGARPLRLLLKYPVRMALNPFVSGLGGLFPQLVSGAAIVAIVLSLPTVGPLLLDSLMTQDMYLAASMLMVLSLLGVFGTLVSDLLLLWIDPRIRFGGGTR
ncbi:MAG: ABC transporter substrate-binding protein [Opitutales bacterium]|nr:ABC transporter substrate-binding protein [Opitutales bacterium]